MHVLIYLLLQAASLLVGMLFWTTLVNGNLYYCSDKVPFLDFIPPFVHTAGQFGSIGDYFIVDEKVVWAVWFLLIGLILLIPYVLARKLRSSKFSGSSWYTTDPSSELLMFPPKLY